MIYSKKNFKWKILKENKIYDSSWVKLYLQKIKLPNGKIIDDYHRIRIKSSVVILPILKNKNIITIVIYCSVIIDRFRKYSIIYFMQD